MDSAVPIMRREEVQLETKKLKSSRSQVVFKIGILKNFAIFTGEHLCWTLFLMRPETFSLKACNFIKKRLQHRYFLVNIVNFLRTAFFIEHLQWLLLKSCSLICRLWTSVAKRSTSRIKSWCQITQLEKIGFLLNESPWPSCDLTKYTGSPHRVPHRVTNEIDYVKLNIEINSGTAVYNNFNWKTSSLAERWLSWLI